MRLAARNIARLCLTSLTLLQAFACADPDVQPPRARTLFVLGDSYAVASAHYLIPHARALGCDVHYVDVTKNGWRAEQILESRESWLPRLTEAPAPVLVYLTIGFNDMLAPGHEKSPAAAARVVASLVELLRHEVGAEGGEVVQVGYDDIWSLPDHEVYFGGKPYPLRRELSAVFDAYYAELAGRVGAAADGSSPYRFVDVRGWLGESLWTRDGIHMVHENYEAQAALLWEREFSGPLGCDGALKAKTPN